MLFAWEISAERGVRVITTPFAMHAVKGPNVKLHVKGWIGVSATPCARETSAGPSVTKITAHIVMHAVKDPNAKLHVKGWI